MRKKISQYDFGAMTVCYLTDESGRVELTLSPIGLKEKIRWEKQGRTDSMVQLTLEGDAAGGGFAAGHTERNAGSTDALIYQGQNRRKSGNIVVIETDFSHKKGLHVRHSLGYKRGCPALWCKTSVVNTGEEELVLTMLSSFSLGMLTPFPAPRGDDQLCYYRIRSKWSAEGKVERGSITDLQLERSWSGHGVAVEKFGETGSLPVRKFFPFAAVGDTENGVVWAAALCCASSWQMELYRRDESLCMSGGIADFESGHWKKHLAPGEAFETPEAYLTVCQEGFDRACQNLTALQERAALFSGEGKRLPVVFNEYCTSWGKPDAKSIAEAAAVLKGRDFDYFVIDAGWYADKELGWEHNMGDWEISKELFEEGLEKSVDDIREAGLKPGIWFEPEVVGKLAKALRFDQHLLKRNGYPVRSGERFFWDMRDSWTKQYLQKKVTDFLTGYGFAYVKIDYNESIGVGCDGAESLGQGLYESVQASKEFFGEMRRRAPGICMELCASGGHRTEPSMIRLADLVSFSDAHEEPEIPVIAANLHRVIRPDKSLVWCVVRKTDSMRRLCYSMTAAFLGVLCISGDVAQLDDGQWGMIERGIAFYRRLCDIQTDGITAYYGTEQKSFRRLAGWQGIWRRGTRGPYSYLVLHSFEENQEIRIAMGTDDTPEDVYEAEHHELCFEGGELVVKMKGAYDSLAVLWKNQKDV